jgi:geranylgeranyl pyrophosphate synthase
MYVAHRSTDTKIHFPEKFQGLFASSRSRFEPMIVDARKSLTSLAVPNVLRPYFDYGVLAHPQPSFILAPLMYLAMAESQGGITKRHRAYLPGFLLMVELIGILDDTVDHTPLRSGRTTYWRRYGSASAAPFSCYLLSAAIEQTMAVAPELLPLVTRMFEDICAAETWEHGARYPRADIEELSRWLQSHYDAVPLAISHSLDSALILHGLPAVDPEVCVRFAELQQDVDDVVNFVERREDDGENDDLKMGIVTYPLLATLRKEPKVAALLEELWQPYRTAENQAMPNVVEERTTRAHAELSELITDIGIPATIEKISRDAHLAIDAAADSVRPCVSDMVWTFVERLCRIEQLRSEVERRCPAVRRVQSHVQAQV